MVTENPRKDPLRGEKGFTLIEIIAVLIILGILAAVAIPKYFELQDDAAKAALKRAVSELTARDNLSWAKYKSGDTDTFASIADLNDITKVVNATADTGFYWFGDFAVDKLDAGAKVKSRNFTIQVTLDRTAASENSPGIWETNTMVFLDKDGNTL